MSWMWVFAMQHGMVWAGNPILPEQHPGVPYDEAANRLRLLVGPEAQAGYGRPPMHLCPATPRPPACSASTLPRRCSACAVRAVQPHARLTKRWPHDPARYGPVLFSLILPEPVQHLSGRGALPGWGCKARAVDSPCYRQACQTTGSMHWPGDDVPEGDVIGIKVAGKDIALYEVEGEVYATDNPAPTGPHA